MSTLTPSLPEFPADARLQAFCDSRGPHVFGSIAFGPEVWRPDPFDVATIHAEARDEFARLLNLAIAPPAGDYPHGRMFLLLGESGAGKTHLMRAFRQVTHAAGSGYFAYLQLTANVADYSQYILRNVVESLGHPYGVETSSGVPLSGGRSGLFRLSDGLAEHPAAPAETVAALREGEHKNYLEAAWAVADALLDSPEFAHAGLDENFVRALLILQRREPRLTRRVTAFLRGDDLTAYDRDFLGGIAPRTGADDARVLLEQFARVARVSGGAFVVCLDQLEFLFEQGKAAEEKFRSAMQAAQLLADANPASIVVVACLEDYYAQLKGALHPTTVYRLELDPAPVRLRGNLALGEIHQLVARRLEHLYETMDVAPVPAGDHAEVYPFDPAEFTAMARANLRTREVLHACHRAREASVRGGRPPRLLDDAPDNSRLPIIVPPNDTLLDSIHVEQRWNEFRANSTLQPPEDDAELAALLAWAITGAAEESSLPAGTLRASALHALVEVDAPAPCGRLLIGMCNKGAAGGALGKQITALRTAAGAAGRTPAAVRGTAFPGKAGSVIARLLGELIARDHGRRVVIEDGEWRAYALLREFLRREAARPDLDVWRRADRPLSRLAGLRELLQLEALAALAAPAAHVAASSTADTADGAAEPGAGGRPVVNPPPVVSDPEDPLATGPIPLGRTREMTPRPVVLDPGELTRHAVFLGGSGSGKTTLACALVEHLLLRGVPVVLLDRKGDLCRYADPAAWETPAAEDAAIAARRARLRDQIDVALFTPGSAPLGRGRPLAISLLPDGAGRLPGAERETLARQAAFSLGAMMGYRTTGADGARLAVLGQAIATLAELRPDAELSLDGLIAYLNAGDETLVNAVGHLYDPKHFKLLVRDLGTFGYQNGHLLATPATAGRGAERVNAEALLGLGTRAVPGRTRLTIISTKFLGDTANALFWIAQLLLELNRHAAHHPSPTLQAAVLFDEADLYLPAVGRPATKEGMENALRRWRSAGLAMLLATQSPGDFDYKCRDQVRTWFAGRVKETVALNKMRPMLAEVKFEVADRLGGLKAGEFFVLRDGGAESLAAGRALLAPEQLADEEILRLAELGQPGADR